MRRLPPPSSATLPSAFLSFLLHAGAVLAGIMVIPVSEPAPVSTPMVYVPIELVTIDDTTNLTAVAAADTEAPREEDMKTEAATPPPPPPPDEDSVSFDEPKEKVKDPPKPKDNANPPPPKPAKSFQDDLDDILKGVTKDKPKAPKNEAGAAPATAKDDTPRMSVGDRKRMTASITDIIRSQLISKGCWADHSDMADARRLKATFRVWFGRNGKFSQEAQLVSPGREPSGDPPLQTFVQHARRALSMCNQIGWLVPEEYFRLPQPQYIDLEFLPKIGATQ
jgi:outer membrane biosynthesis protein TonB